MAVNASPVVDEADEDEDDDHDDLDHSEPVLGLSYPSVRKTVDEQVIVGTRTIYADVDELHGKNRCNDHEGILPCGDVWVPVL